MVLGTHEEERNKHMANCQQYKRSSARNVIAEATRELKSYKNDVDRSRSHLNYNLIEGSDTRAQIMQKIDDRVRDVMGTNIRKQTKKNMKPLGTWIVTLPRELNGLNDDEKRDFFETTLDFLGDRYGKENIVYANVHNDESQPHMHIGIVPVCTSRKTGKETVSAASMFTKKDLINFHKDLDKVMEKKYGQARLINNGRTKGNYTIEELKERKAVEERLTLRENNVRKAEMDLGIREANLRQKEAELTQREADIVAKENQLANYITNELTPKVESIKAGLEANDKTKQELEEEREYLKEYKGQLQAWKDTNVETLTNQLRAVKMREIEAEKREEEQKARDEALDVRERNLQGKEDRLTSRETAILAKDQQVTRERVQVNAERLRVESEKREAQKLMQQANERLDEVKATESRIQKMLEELKERGKSLVTDIKATIGRWTSQVRQSTKPNATEYFADRTEQLGEDLEAKREHENFVTLAYEDLNFYNEDMHDALEL